MWINVTSMSTDQVLKEIAKGPRPKRSRIAIAGTALGVAVLVAGTVLGVNAANAYRADIEQSQATAKEYYEAAAEQVELADQAAQDAAESATAADEAVTAAEAEEAAAAAAAAAQAAADAAAQAAADAAAAPQQPSSGGGSNPGAKGDHVPFVTSSDPNNANGGDYLDPGTYCDSGSASTVGGVPVCD
jgi:hypothetical protein